LVSWVRTTIIFCSYHLLRWFSSFILDSQFQRSKHNGWFWFFSCVATWFTVLCWYLKELLFNLHKQKTLKYTREKILIFRGGAVAHLRSQRDSPLAVTPRPMPRAGPVNHITWAYTSSYYKLKYWTPIVWYVARVYAKSPFRRGGH